MDDLKKANWLLRIGVFGSFFGHGVFAIQTKASFIPLITSFGFSEATAITLLPLIGLMDIFVAFMALLWPLKAILVWAAFWGFMTGLSRPVAGMPVWDFVERWANWAAPLALLAMNGFPKKLKELLKV